MGNKNWFIKPQQMSDKFHWNEPEGCLATDRILVNGCKVGYMYRVKPNPNSKIPDSGWVFTAGDESEEYMDDSRNIGIYSLNTIANYDSDIIPFLSSPYGSAFYRDNNGALQQDLFED